MAILKFNARAVAARIAHARACDTFIPRWDGPVDRAGLILMVGHGVHIMSNGLNDHTTRLVGKEDQSPEFTYAEGLNPFRDADWMSERHAAFRTLTGHYHLDLIDEMQMLIDRGYDTVRLATDGHSVNVFTAQTSDYMIGGLYKVPSGLGGVFYVTLQDMCDRYAVVKNTGNCEDFDQMQPYKVALDDLAERDTARAA